MRQLIGAEMLTVLTGCATFLLPPRSAPGQGFYVAPSEVWAEAALGGILGGVVGAALDHPIHQRRPNPLTRWISTPR